MASLSYTGVRVVDPILTHHVQGYQNATFVGDALFPTVPVKTQGGQVIEFGKEAFMLYNLRRAPGGPSKRIEFGYVGKPYTLIQEALEAKVPTEFHRDAMAVPGIDLAAQSVDLTMKVIKLSLEYQQASIATNTNNYDSNHKKDCTALKWSAAGGLPITDINNGRDAIRATIGVRPNVLVLSAQAWKAVRDNAQVLERFKYTTSGPVSIDQFAKLVEIPRVVLADAVYSSDSGAFSDVWGNTAVLAYVPLTPSSIQEPSYGYTYTMEGHPSVKQPYYENSTESWIYKVIYERQPVLTGMTAGYLFYNCA